MRIYVAHSKEIDYLNELYKPLRNDSFFSDYELILPHENNEYSSNSREFYKSIDLLIAECSEAATGLGIELGWAYDDNKTIYCIHKSDKKISNSIKAVTNNIYEYESVQDMLKLIKRIISCEDEQKGLLKK